MVRIKLSGALKEIGGGAELEFALPPSRRLDELLQALDVAHPGILGSAAEYQWRHGSDYVIIAVNACLVEPGDEQMLLNEGDEVALIPPLGGGSTTISGKSF